MKTILLLIRFYNFKKELVDQFIKEKKHRPASNGSIKKIYVCLLSKYIQKEYFMQNKSSIKDGFYKILVFNVSIFFFSAE